MDTGTNALQGSPTRGAVSRQRTPEENLDQLVYHLLKSPPEEQKPSKDPLGHFMKTLPKANRDPMGNFIAMKGLSGVTEPQNRRPTLSPSQNQSTQEAILFKPLPAIDPSEPYSVVSGDTYGSIAGRLMSLFPEKSQKNVSDELQTYFKNMELKAGMSVLDLPAFLKKEEIPYSDEGKASINPSESYPVVRGDSFYSIARRLKQAGQFPNLSPQELVTKLQGYFGEDLIAGVSIDMPGFIREPSGLTPKPKPAPLSPKERKKAPSQPVWKQLSGKGPPPEHIHIPNVEYAKTHKLTKEQISSLIDKVSKDPKINVPKAIWMAKIFQESSDRPYINSANKAVGLGQLLAPTAREVGLKVNDEIDERFDPEKSLQGGGRYLTEMYRRFKDPSLSEEENWKQALTAYIAGPRNFRNGTRIGPQSKAYGPKILALARLYNEHKADTSLSETEKWAKAITAYEKKTKQTNQPLKH